MWGSCQSSSHTVLKRGLIRQQLKTLVWLDCRIVGALMGLVAAKIAPLNVFFFLLWGQINCKFSGCFSKTNISSRGSLSSHEPLWFSSGSSSLFECSFEDCVLFYTTKRPPQTHTLAHRHRNTHTRPPCSVLLATQWKWIDIDLDEHYSK